MLTLAIALFVLAAIFGLVILTHILKNKPTPKRAVFSHGPIAATALILVIVYILMGHMDPLLITSAVLFVFAALGGLTMFKMDMKNKPISKMIAIFHPILAVIALILLITYVLQMQAIG